MWLMIFSQGFRGFINRSVGCVTTVLGYRARAWDLITRGIVGRRYNTTCKNLAVFVHVKCR
jgi:hypothetical protein